MVVAGNQAYVGNSSGIVILDISDPENPVFQASTYPDTGINGPTVDIKLSGGLAYAVRYNSIYIVDVSDPLNPQVLGSEVVASAFGVRGIELVGDHAFVATTYGISVVDATDPANPSEVAVLVNGSDAVTGIEVAGDYAYLGLYQGLRVVDIANPLAPVAVGFLATSEKVNAVEVIGSRAYLANDDAGLVIVDVSDHTAPQPEGSSAYYGGARRVVVVEGNRALVATDGGLCAIDISDPANPRYLGSRSVGAQGLDASRGFAYATADWVFSVVDVQSLAFPQFLGDAALADFGSDVRIEGSLAYVVADPSGLTVLDVSNPEQPQVLGSVSVPGSPRDLDVQYPYAFVTDWNVGFHIVDVSAPEIPQIVGSHTFTPAVNVWDIGVQGDYAYFTTSGAFRVVDVSDPQNPAEVAAYFTSSPSGGKLAIQGNYVFRTTGGYLAATDISDPTNPQNVDYVSTGYPMSAVAVQGDLVFVSDGDLLVVDAADPTQLAVVGTATDTPLYGYMEVKNGFLYGTDDWGTNIVDIVDVSDPSNPQRTASIDTKDTARGIHCVGGALYVASDTGLRILAGQCVQALGAPPMIGPRPNTLLVHPYPSPFWSSTTLGVALETPAFATLSVHDVQGRLVRTLLRRELPEGVTETVWDGTDRTGDRVPSGVYFVRVSTGMIKESRSVILAK